MMITNDDEFSRIICYIQLDYCSDLFKILIDIISKNLAYVLYKSIARLFRDGFFNTIFVSSHMYPENPEGTQVIAGLINMGYIYIRHCQESNSQPVPSQAGADTTLPQ